MNKRNSINFYHYSNGIVIGGIPLTIDAVVIFTCLFLNFLW